MIITTDEEREVFRSAGKHLRSVLDAVIAESRAGVSAADLDSLANKEITARDCQPSFLNYKPGGSSRAFPATLCVSVNNEVVHGIPHREKVLKDGDVVSLDCGLIYQGVYVDTACTTIIGAGSPEARKLVDATRKASGYAMMFVHSGSTTDAIGSAVEGTAREYNFTVPPELGGHGVGAAQHEDPFIPNIGGTKGVQLQEGQVVAIEPIFFSGKDPRVVTSDDGFTIETADGSLSAHFEHTVIVQGDKAPEIITGPLW
ncbi:MAG: type I methionyl aminopeptidase [Candidatus Kaiserbacteria bacterium]|nr:type I methionyl aminopeptidase [Candidatus Kaiserbacteria bacterium]